MSLLIFGAPGAGKGTQAGILIKEFSLTPLATGDLLREEIAAKTPLGTKIAELVAKGKFVGDDIVLSLLSQALERVGGGGVLLDGFPRNLVQAKALENVLPDAKIKAVVYLDLPQELLLERICGRLSCPKCKAIYHRSFAPPKQANICDKCHSELVVRRDDNPESVKVRLAEYNSQTKPLLEFYEAKGLLVSVDGEGSPSEVSARLKQAVS